MNFVTRFVRPFFFSKDDNEIKPIRFFITFFLLLIATGVIMKLAGADWISDALIGILTAQLGLLLGADTWRQNAKTKFNGVHKEE